ncbi:MAG: PAS domain S-box protein [Planctomycetes bacterium]|nr:PAS domain S-box protein [Planctomycetota bacterium]
MGQADPGKPESSTNGHLLESRFSALQNLASIGYWELNLETEEFFFTPLAYRFFMLGPETDKPTRSNLKKYVHPDDIAAADAMIEQTIKTGGTCSAQIRIISDNGHPRWISLHCRVMPREEGEPLRVQGSSHDITEPKNAEIALRRERQRSEDAQRLAHFGYWDWHIPSGQVTWSNEVYCIFGLSKKDFAPSIQGILERAHPEDRDMGDRLIKQAIANRRPGRYEMRIFRPDGEMRWFESNFEPFFDESGALEYIIGTAHDVTERKRAEHLAVDREQRLRVTLNSIGDGVIATDINRKITQINPVAERLTGWHRDDAIGRDLNDVFSIISTDTRLTDMDPVQSVLSTGETIHLDNQTVLVRRDDNKRRIADSVAPIRDEDGHVVGVVLVFRDVTEDLALQEQLRQSQKLEAIGQLAGGVAHDFNNMLGGIFGLAELLSPHVSGNDLARKYLDLILETANRAAGLTESLLVFSRRQPTASTAIDVHDSINSALDLLRNTTDRRIVITASLEAESCRVVADPPQMQSAILNLCINAVHAMPEGGEIQISTQTTVLDKHYCLASTFDLVPGEYLQINIRDTGHGISAENLSRIFDPFFTTKEVGHGTGLGLAAVYGAIQKHHGAITVYSEEGVGTNFQILLPLAHDAPVSPEKASPEPVRGIGRILVVDDEPVMRMTAQDILEDLGYSVLLAENGKQALEQYRQEADNIDLVILDMIMPEMNGRDCFHAIREIRPDARVLLSSGFAPDEDIEKMQNSGLMGFVRKPYRLVALSQQVANCLKSE